MIQLERQNDRVTTPYNNQIFLEKQYLYNPQRVFLSPSAFTLEKGVTEFRNTMVFHNNMDFGITDNLTIGAGFSSVIISNALSGKVKLGGSLSPHLHVAAGVQGMVLFPGYGDDAVSVGLLYGALTVGTKDKFLTASVGLGRDSDYGESTAGLTIGGAIRTSENWRIFLEFIHFDPYQSEDYYSNYNTTMGTLGMSWFKGVHQIDFGLYGNSEWGYDTAIIIPIAAYSLRF